MIPEKIFTPDEIRFMVSITDVVLDSGVVEDPELLARYMAAFNLKAECEKVKLLLANLQYWMEKAEMVKT